MTCWISLLLAARRAQRAQRKLCRALTTPTQQRAGFEFGIGTWKGAVGPGRGAVASFGSGGGGSPQGHTQHNTPVDACGVPVGRCPLRWWPVALGFAPGRGGNRERTAGQGGARGLCGPGRGKNHASMNPWNLPPGDGHRAVADVCSRTLGDFSGREATSSRDGRMSSLAVGSYY